MAGAHSALIVGRRREADLLAATRVRAMDGEAAVTIVTGEAGIGKSRLVAADGETAAAEGWLVMRGSCLEMAGGPVAYLPFVEMLRELVVRLPADALQRVLGPATEAVSRLLPTAVAGDPVAALGGPTSDARPAGEGSDLERMRLFELLLGLIHRLAAEAPVLVVIEDLQWVDAASLDLLRFFVHSVRRDRVALVLTARTGGSDAPTAIERSLAQMEREGSVARLDLQPFDRAAVLAQVSALEGRTPDPARVDELLARSGGNPWFVAELAAVGPDAADGRRKPDEADAVRSPASAVPTGLRDVLRAELANLGPSAREVCRVASAAGTLVSDAILLRVVDLPEAETLRGLREALAAAVLVPGRGPDGLDGYRFRQPLVREVMADELTPLESRRFHAAFAEALADQSMGLVAPAELAYHWDAAGDAGRALEASVAAAQAAEAAYAFGDARRHYERALELWSLAPYPDDRLAVDRLTLVERAAAMAALTGDDRAAIEMTREALASVDEVEDPTQAVLLHSRLRWYLWDAGEAEAALDDALAAVRLVPAEPPSDVRANVLGHAAGLLLFAGRFSAAETHATEAISIAREVGARPEEALASGVLGWVRVQAGDLDAGVALVRQALDIALDIGHATGTVLAYEHLAGVLDVAGRSDESIEAGLDGARAASGLGMARTMGAQLEGDATQTMLRLGRWVEADELTARSLERGAAPGPLAWLQIVRARLEAARGRTREAHLALEAAAASAGGGFPKAYVGWWHVAQAETQLSSDDTDAAVSSVRAALVDPRLPGMDGSIEALIAVGSRAAADVLEDVATKPPAASAARDLGETLIDRWERLSKTARRIPPDLPVAGPAPVGRRRTNRAVLIEAEIARLAGRNEARRWRRVVEIADADGWRPLAAYGRYRLASAVLAERGDREAVAALLRAAHATAVALGAAPLREEIESLARRARIAVERPAAEAAPSASEGPSIADAGSVAPYGLTDREREVLALLADGLSNREIGEALFISPKTASVHVSNILAKLEVDGRVEAATMAIRLGIVPAAASASGPVESDRPARG